MDAEFRKRFLTKSDESGRFIIKSIITGKSYFVECIDNSPHHRIWGDVDPADKTLHGEYGKKYKGSISDEESMITKDNGFTKIHELGIGESPYSYVDRLDKEYENR